MPTRSARLWQRRLGAGGPVTVYVVPPDTVTILKHFALNNWSGVSAHVTVYLQNQAGSIAIYLLEEDIPQATSVSWEGWIVLEEGDGVTVTYDQQPVDAWGSGAELLSAG